jgi:hypothetical protein
MPDERIGGGFTEGELKFASFWVRNRVLLERIRNIALITINVGVWSFVLWGLLDAYAISYPRESRITAEIAHNQFLAAQLEGNKPQNVQPGGEGVKVFQATDSRLDFIVPVLNPNTDWWVEFTYRFNVSGEMTPARSGFLIPGEKTYLGEFGFKPTTAGARSGVLTVDNVRWHRIDRSLVGADYPAWLARRKQFRVENITFTTDAATSAAPASGSAANRQFSRTSFDFVNPSAYGFWQVKLYIVLKRGGSSMAATSITLDRVQPGETRHVNVDWFERLPAATETEVVPVVNFLDTSVYLPSEQTGE